MPQMEALFNQHKSGHIHQAWMVCGSTSPNIDRPQSKKHQWRGKQENGFPVFKVALPKFVWNHFSLEPVKIQEQTLNLIHAGSWPVLSWKGMRIQDTHPPPQKTLFSIKNTYSIFLYKKIRNLRMGSCIKQNQQVRPDTSSSDCLRALMCPKDSYADTHSVSCSSFLPAIKAKHWSFFSSPLKNCKMADKSTNHLNFDHAPENGR